MKSTSRSRRRGRPEREAEPALDRERLIAALLRLVKREGLEAVTMRRVAGEAQVSVRLLYDHVRDRMQMIDLACELITAEAVPEVIGGSWRHRLTGLARAVRRSFIAYPGLAAWVLSQATADALPLTPRRVERQVQQALADAGLSHDQMKAAYLAYVAFTMGHLALAGGARARRAEMDRLFETGLDMLLRGFESRAARKRR